MPLTPATEQSIRRVFREGLIARNIAEPLASFDTISDIELVRDFMAHRHVIQQTGLFQVG